MAIAFPLTAVNDVETSFLEGTILEFLYVEEGSGNRGKFEGLGGGELPGALNKLQSMSTLANIGGAENVLVNNLAGREQFRMASSSAEWWCCLCRSVYLCVLEGVWVQ